MDKLVRTCVSLDSATVSTLKMLGRGNLSAGIRAASAFYESHLPSTQTPTTSSGIVLPLTVEPDEQDIATMLEGWTDPE